MKKLSKRSRLNKHCYCAINNDEITKKVYYQVYDFIDLYGAVAINKWFLERK